MYRAKQTQFPRRRDGSRGRLCETKPIRHPLARDPRDRSRETKPITSWRCRARTPNLRGANRAKQTQSRAAGDWGQVVQTKPIPGRRQDEAWGARDVGALVQTNPIPRLRISHCGLRIQDGLAGGRPLRAAGPGAGCTNKPNSAGPIVRNKANWAGRPHLGARSVRNKPNSPAGGRGWGHDYAKQSQFATPDRQAGSWPEAIVRNKANFWSRPGQWIRHPPPHAGRGPV